jgi:uncharacterized protein (PEP-CTERM system associated)
VRGGPRSLARCAAVGGILVSLAGGAAAETWRFEPSLGVEETLTSNADLNNTTKHRNDFVTQLTHGFRVQKQVAHTSLNGFVALPVLFYARTGADNNKVEPNANLLGTWELVDRLLFVDGAIAVNQQYLSPFGARSDSLVNATNNRYTSQIYRISPYLKGDAGSEYSYELRDNNIFTNGNANVVTGAYTNELIGSFRRDPRPFGWAVEINRADTKFQGQDRQLTELARLRGLYQVDPQVQLSTSGGYEHNELLVESTDNVVYGAGIRWRPTDRTNFDANWEHRFFGSSYNVSFDHRAPLSVWSLSASRNITTYPQQLASLPGGTDVAGALNALFLSRVPDAAQRQALVNQLIVDRGLPAVLSNAVNLYTQQITLQQSLLATAGFLGARNTMFFSAYHQRNEPITGSGIVLPPFLSLFNNNTQIGGNLVWSHSLTPVLTLTGSVDGSRTESLDQSATSKQGSVGATLTQTLSALTSVYTGIRYQVFHSNVSADYEEAAVFVGVNHRFH